MDTASRFVVYLGWVLGPLWPVAAAAAAWLIGGTAWRMRSGRPLTTVLLEPWLLLLVPLLVLAWGAVAHGWAEGPRPDWPSWVVLALAALEPIALLRICWRDPKSLGVVLPVGAAGLVLTLLAAFISAMSVVNDWI